MTENKYKIVSSNVEEGIYTRIRKDGNNAFTLKEAMEYVEEHEQSARETNTELEIVPLPNCLYVEDETTKTFLTTNLYDIDFDKRYDYVIKEHPHLNIKWQSAPMFYYDGFEQNEVDNEAAFMFYNKHQINEVGCDKEIKFMDMDEFLNSNPNINNPTETIGDFVKEHITDYDEYVCLNDYYEKYLNEEDKELFSNLTLCTDGFLISAEFDEDGDVVVEGNESRYKTYYDSDYPVVDVYKELLTKMNEDLKQSMECYKKACAESFMLENGDIRIWGADDAETYNSLIYFGDDYGFEFKEGDDPYRGMYVDIIGINE